MRYVMYDKMQRQKELQLIEQERHKLQEEQQKFSQMMQTIEQRNNDLKAREAKLNGIEPLLPSIRELQNAGITFDLIMPLILAINEKAAIKM